MRRAIAVLVAFGVVAALAGWMLRAKDDGPARSEASGGAAAVVSSTSSTALPEGSAYVAHSTVPRLAVYDAADGGALKTTLANPIETGGPLVLLVDGDGASGGDRLQVELPVRPNGSRGWVERADVTLLTNPYRIEVDLSDRRLRVLRHDDEVVTSAVAVGAPSTPTPTGHYFLTELLIQPNAAGAYGPFAYGLSAHSNVLTDFKGGSGQVGMHGTNDPSSIGRAVSHGCIRLPNDVLREVRSFLPLGTPIDVVD